MRNSTAGAAVRQRLMTLDDELRTRLEADAEGLHRARVATRRLREALPLVASADGPALEDFRELVRQATRALGGVREMDVALALVDTIAGERPELQPALNLVRTSMVNERLARLERMREQVNPRRLRHASRSLARRLEQFVDDAPSIALAELLLERIEEFRGAVVEAGVLYAPERLHRVRLATKKLRYALELAGEMRAIPIRRLVADLRRIQECLGLLHDLEIVAQHGRETLGEAHLAEPAGQLAGPTLSLVEARIHAQHACYLAEREHVEHMVDRAMAVRARVLPHASAARPGRS